MATYLQQTKTNITAATQHGHTPVSSGCGMFRCTACNLSAYLDTTPDTRWFEPCRTPGKFKGVETYSERTE